MCIFRCRNRFIHWLLLLLLLLFLLTFFLFCYFQINSLYFWTPIFIHIKFTVSSFTHCQYLVSDFCFSLFSSTLLHFTLCGSLAHTHTPAHTMSSKNEIDWTTFIYLVCRFHFIPLICCGFYFHLLRRFTSHLSSFSVSAFSIHLSKIMKKEKEKLATNFIAQLDPFGYWQFFTRFLRFIYLDFSFFSHIFLTQYTSYFHPLYVYHIYIWLCMAVCFDCFSSSSSFSSSSFSFSYVYIYFLRCVFLLVLMDSC